MVLFSFFSIFCLKKFFFLQGERDFRKQKNKKIDQFLTLKRAKVRPVKNAVCAVKLKSGPFFAFLKVTGQMFCLFFVFWFSKISFSLHKEEDFSKTCKNNPKKHFYKLKTGPIMLRNMLGPIFNLYLDQF